jgi:signal peptidase
MSDSDGSPTERVRPYVKPLALLALVLLVAPFVVFAVPGIAGMEGSYVVLTSSMSPTIPAGSMILVNDVPAAEIQRDDVITFESPGGVDETSTGPDRITHRVVAVVERNGTTYFRTQGDANEEPDPNLVPPGNLVGRVAFHVPLAGRVVQFANSDVGVFGLVIVPAVLLALNEVYNLYSAASGGDGGEDRDDDDEAEGE